MGECSFPAPVQFLAPHQVSQHHQGTYEHRARNNPWALSNQSLLCRFNHFYAYCSGVANAWHIISIESKQLGLHFAPILGVDSNRWLQTGLGNDKQKISGEYCEDHCWPLDPRHPVQLWSVQGDVRSWHRPVLGLQKWEASIRTLGWSSSHSHLRQPVVEQHWRMLEEF